MAKELAHFKNFAKLKDTKVAFNDITVIAGKPGTGKSYVMKMMYARVEAFASLESKMKIYTEESKDFSNKTESIHSNLKNIEQELQGASFFKKLFNSNTFKKKIDHIHNEITILEKRLEGSEIHSVLESDLDDNTLNELYTREINNILKSIFSSISQISKNFSIKTNILQITYEDNIKVKINSKNDTEKKKLDNNILDYGEIIFVETPLILEFKKFMKREKGKTPYHIESLLNILDTDYSFTDEEQDNFIKEFTQKSKEIIKGDIESSGDSFIFNKEGDKNYDIVNASSGTKSIGLLQYLVTNKALKKGSVLYWEEPEVHLHPEWQLRMIELFVELMNAGVKIVFSTHSPYMCDYLNAISQKQGFNDRVSFNLFEETDGVVNNHILENDEDWNKIQAELLDPLEEIMWEYI